MLEKRMYVRFPADAESISDPRVFMCGQIAEIDEFKKTVTIKIHDPFEYLQFFENYPKNKVELPIQAVDHCGMFIGSDVMVHGKICTVRTRQKDQEGYFAYYVQDKKSKDVFEVSEKEIVAAFNNGHVDPSVQLARYEFQNPCWHLGHSVVSRSMNILNNSINGFKELAGSKIYLLPHQVNTIMRCLQEKPCRFMLADEVGMGKTVEAISILKIYMQDKACVKALIVVPKTLKAQWEKELLLKFNLSTGTGENYSSIAIKSVQELDSMDLNRNWDFVIVDEVHRCLSDKIVYEQLHRLSRKAQNVLLLSATPVQQRKGEYLALLRLLQPEKYDNYTDERFSQLIDKQSKIVQKTALILDDMVDYQEEISAAQNEQTDPHESDECRDLFDEIVEDLQEVCNALGDEKLSKLLKTIDFSSGDLGVYDIKVVVSYICASYQIESNIIRNRRRILEMAEDGQRLMPTRELKTVPYSLDRDKNIYETLCYQEISDWLENNGKDADVENSVRLLLSSFFSSPWAFSATISSVKKEMSSFPEELEEYVRNWIKFEDHIVKDIADILDDPDSYEAEYSTRLVTILDLLYDELYDQKIVLFTNFAETFLAYRIALQKVFQPDEIAFFGAGMSPMEIELNSYRFQNDKNCRIMLCDYTGGEGRNFQCADYIVHIDLPWDASTIEQRIGRLDRLERDPSRPVVHSVLVYAQDTFEEALYRFWNEGLKIFTQSLSGMEIIMRDVDREIVSAVKENFKYGLFDRIPQIVELAKSMRSAVQKEQNYDAAAFVFRPMYTELKRLVNYYAQNENELFASAMTNWASLAGFKGFRSDEDLVTYTAESFSLKAAFNSQLIPPRWNDYLMEEQNKFVTSVQDEYDRNHQTKNPSRAIRGTFTRKRAIENDYIHFFAPGDDVFDCIVNNAILSCKGCSSAFAIESNLNWKGFVFVFAPTPNESYLLENGVSVHTLSAYRNYLMSEQVIIPYSIENPEEYTDGQIVQEYLKQLGANILKEKTVHFGKRSRETSYLSSTIGDVKNIEWFRGTYSEERWREMVVTARKSAHEKALEQIRKRSNIRGAREEMERVLSAREASQVYYGQHDDKILALKEEQKVVLEALRRPKILLDSVAFIWMVKN